MSDQPTDTTPTAPPTPADVAPKAPEPAAAAPNADAPPWGDDFDAEKAWNLVQNLRSDKERLQQRPALTDEQKAKLAEYDRLAEASKSELEKAQEAAQKNEARAQALLDRTVKAEVKALASQGFADPEDAAAFLDLSKYATGDGDVDSAAIAADLSALLERKPHLGKSPESRTPAPNPAQGSSGSGASGAVQRSAEWVQQQSAAGNHEAISKARAAGELDDYLKS